MTPLEAIPDNTATPPASLYASLIGQRFCAITNFGRIYAEGALQSVHWAPHRSTPMARLDSGHLVPFARLVYAEPMKDGGTIGAPRFHEDEVDEKIKAYLFSAIEQVVNDPVANSVIHRIEFGLFELVEHVEGSYSVAGGSRCGKRIRRHLGEIFNVGGTAWQLERQDRVRGGRYRLVYLPEGAPVGRQLHTDPTHHHRTAV